MIHEEQLKEIEDKMHDWGEIRNQQVVIEAVPIVRQLLAELRAQNKAWRAYCDHTTNALLRHNGREFNIPCSAENVQMTMEHWYDHVQKQISEEALQNWRIAATGDDSCKNLRCQLQREHEGACKV